MKFLACLLIAMTTQAFAQLRTIPAHGFHWYSKDALDMPSKPKPRPQSIPKPTPYEQLMEVRKATLNKLASALIEPSFDATYDYMKAQQGYAKKNQQFVRFWQEVLLVHPELDHSLNFPTDNSAIAIQNDSTNALIEKIVMQASKHYGFILYYKGKSALSQKFITHLVPFVEASHFSMISVTTDGQSIKGLPNPKNVPLKLVQKTMKLQSRYMPALFLVNLQTQKMSPLSYGFVSLTELKERLLDVVTHYKRFSYEGLSQ
ncbi:MAG: type-F conjugative transfer system pilin assembly protein TraF [Legionella sp.]|nr:type-F conjugative transfer system pilin assembly protein TraF [Legionella sp.]